MKKKFKTINSKYCYELIIKSQSFPYCRALDKNEYNHITATYFLLAERRLKIARQETAQAEGSNSMSSNNGKSSPKKPLGDVVDAAIDILSSNLLAPPSSGYYNNSRAGADGVATNVSKIQLVEV